MSHEGLSALQDKPRPDRPLELVRGTAGFIGDGVQQGITRSGVAAGTSSERKPSTPGLSAYARDPYIIGAVLFGLALRLVRLDYAPLWFDETFTARHMASSYLELVADLLGGKENSLPGYMMLLKSWTLVAGTSPWMLRFPSVVLSCVAIVLTAALAGTLVSRQAARWAALLAAISPYLLQHAQEARMYSMVAALAAASLLLFSRYLTRSTAHLGVAFVLVSIALLTTHYYAVFLVAGQVLALILLRRREPATWLPAASVVSLGCLVAILTALFAAAHNAGGEYKIGALAFPGLVWSMIAGYALVPSSEALHAQGIRAALAYLPGAAVGAVCFAIAALAGLRSMRKPALVVTATVLLVTLVAPFVATAVLDIGVNPRYAMAGAPMLITLIAAGAPVSSTQWWRLAAAAGLITVMSLGTVLHLADPGQKREDIYAAGRWLDANVPAGEQILITSNEMQTLATFHWPQHHFQLFPAARAVATHDNAVMLAATLPFAEQSDRVVYVFGRAWLSDPDGLLRAELKKQYGQCGGLEVRGISIVCLTRARAPGREAN